MVILGKRPMRPLTEDESANAIEDLAFFDLDFGSVGLPSRKRRHPLTSTSSSSLE